MQATKRSPLAAGVALIGASAIALTPISAPAPAVHVPAIQSAAVQLSASIDPLKAWADLFGNTAVNATTLAEQILANPAPILTQMLRNGAGYAQTVATIASQVGTGLVQWATQDVPTWLKMAAEAAGEGRYDAAIMEALAMPLFALLFPVGIPLMGLSSITVGITENLYNVAKTIANPMTLLGTVLGTMQVWSSTTAALGLTVQSLADAVKAGDALAAVNVLLAAPALIANAVINGNEFTPGILTPESQGGPLPGPIAGVLVQVRRAIAQALGAPAPSVARVAAQPTAGDTLLADGPAAANALPSGAVNTLTVNLSTDTVVKHAVTEAPVEKAPVVETPAEKAPVVEAPAEKAPAVEAPADTVTEKADPVAQISPKITVGKVGTTKANTELKQAADTVGKQLNSTAKKIGDGFKNGFAKPNKKTADSGAGASSGAGAGSSGSSGSSE